MRLFGNRKYDDTDYGSKSRKKEYMARNGIKKGVTDSALIRRHEKIFEKSEQKAAQKAKRRNGGSPY